MCLDKKNLSMKIRMVVLKNIGDVFNSPLGTTSMSQPPPPPHWVPAATVSTGFLDWTPILVYSLKDPEGKRTKLSTILLPPSWAAPVTHCLFFLVVTQDQLKRQLLPIISVVPPGRPISGVITVPGSKSISNRVLLMCALAKGRKPQLSSLAQPALLPGEQTLPASGWVLPSSSPSSPPHESWTNPNEALMLRNSTPPWRMQALDWLFRLGSCKISGLLHAHDTHVMLDSLSKLGVPFEWQDEGTLEILHGPSTTFCGPFWHTPPGFSCHLSITLFPKTDFSLPTRPHCLLVSLPFFFFAWLTEFQVKLWLCMDVMENSKFHKNRYILEMQELQLDF